MANEKKIVLSHGGPSFLSLLTLLFIGLKLTEHIDWSWWYVTLPLWIFPAIILGILAVIGIVVGIGCVVAGLSYLLISKKSSKKS